MWEWLAFAAIMAVGQFSPGPDMLLLTRIALAEGRVAGCWTAFGIACGLGVHALFAVAGVAALMAQGGGLEMLMRSLAAVYLLWLAFQLIRSALLAKNMDMPEAESVSEFNRLKSWKRGLFCNLLNPKVAVFFAGVTAPFLIDQIGWQWPLILWLTIVLEGVLLWCLWVLLLQYESIKAAYRCLARWVDIAFGLALIVIAVALIYGGFSAKFAV